ncbi:MAG: serine/threonine protein kinase [Ruminococcus sp.]|nr:serine/threonine protein kinase [Ruminococcus sp.]
MHCFHCMHELPAGGTGFCPRCGKPAQEPNAPHQLAAGTILNNRYLVGNVIGEGGFGITYIGFDRSLDVPVAIKEYYPSSCANRLSNYSNDITITYGDGYDYFVNGQERFLKEAKSIAKFTDDNGIVDVRDYFTANNTAYIVMEYLEGIDLRRYIKQYGVFRPDAIFRLMLPIMRALGKIHGAGIIHRDISPDNIMYLHDGTLKLTDFGAARQFSDYELKTMSVVLKPGYAPYEQYSRKGNQGPWTDVYSLCATIYTCITGKTPPDSLDRSRGEALAPPSALGVNISPALETILMRGMSLSVEGRIRTAEELKRLTEGALRGNLPPVQRKPQPAPPRSNGKTAAIVALVAAVAVVAGLILFVFLFKGCPSDKKTQPVTIPSSTVALTTNAAEPATEPTTVPPTTTPVTTVPETTVPTTVPPETTEAPTEAPEPTEPPTEPPTEAPESIPEETTLAPETEYIQSEYGD